MNEFVLKSLDNSPEKMDLLKYSSDKLSSPQGGSSPRTRFISESQIISQSVSSPTKINGKENSDTEDPLTEPSTPGKRKNIFAVGGPSSDKPRFSLNASKSDVNIQVKSR